MRRAMLRADVMAAYLEALTAQERVGLAEAAIEVASRARLMIRRSGVGTCLL